MPNTRIRALALGVTQQAIPYSFESLKMIQKEGNWVPYELKPLNVLLHE